MAKWFNIGGKFVNVDAAVHAELGHNCLLLYFDPQMPPERSGLFPDAKRGIKVTGAAADAIWEYMFGRSCPKEYEGAMEWFDEA